MLLKSVTAGVFAIGLFGTVAFSLPGADTEPAGTTTAMVQRQEVESSTELAQNTCCAKHAYCCIAKRRCCGTSAVVESDE